MSFTTEMKWPVTPKENQKLRVLQKELPTRFLKQTFKDEETQGNYIRRGLIPCTLYYKHRYHYSVVGIMTAYGLDDQELLVRIFRPAQETFFFTKSSRSAQSLS